ncbi:transmembrane protein 120B-like [Corticium candelabrum]|uniref:transmembrane protein 120B-like n=1 Tax=Corticium candelabrum TaxID=121492 RepID=UPI002E258D62|nr:transmembrane protein 120B-like [Corticium candelabrum]
MATTSYESDYQELQAEYQKLQRNLAEVRKLQVVCKKKVDIVKKARTADRDSKSNETLKHQTTDRQRELRDIEATLPRKNHWFLQLTLGGLDVTLLTKTDRHLYKQQYEDFKMWVTIVIGLFSFFNLIVYQRLMDASFQFLLVWYYCTLTIREHILRQNGSEIRGWWVLHHYLSIVVSACILIWPVDDTYQMFRMNFMMFSLYISFVQFLQYYYQVGTLYRLLTLGRVHELDITRDGLRIKTWSDMKYLIPALIIGYIWQYYLAYQLFSVWFDIAAGKAWQIFVLSALFLILGTGNCLTLAMTLRQKLIRDSVKLK